ncbi:MAG: hypothetical protein IT251_10360, partial [Chitinophagaceae bacterium]|nr:hypothetical protein [Chitinophagaceae bacterium]
MRVSKFTLLSLLIFMGFVANAQLPIAYYDFEDNSARNTTIETTLETAVSTIGTPTVTDANGLTSSNGIGNGAGYGGSNTGYALGYYGFTTGSTVPTAAASDALPHIIFGPFTTTGIATLTLTMDLMGIGDKRPGNAVIYWSTDNVTYTRIATYPAIGTSFSTESFTLPAGAANQATLYIRVLGYNPSNTGTPDGTNGVMKIDNFTLRSSQINTTLTLANASTHGTGLTSGDTYLPIYSSFYLNSGTGNDVTMSSSLSLSGYVDLTSGNLVVGANTLSFQVQTGNGSTTGPIRKSGADAGFIVFGTSSNMVIGDGTETATTTIPNNSFSAPSGMGNLTINRNTATVNWGNNPIQITGDLTVTSGVFIKNVAAGTIDVDGDVVLSNIGDFRITSVGLNVDGDMNISDDAFFRISATNANVTIAGSLSINDNGQVILSGNNTGSYVSVTVSTNLNIGSAATLDLANNNAIIVVDGNVTGSGTISSAASNRRIVVTGATSTLSKDIFYGNLEINTGGTVSLLGNTFVTGFIRLTAGSLAVGAGNTLSLTAPTIVPIQRNGGSQLGLLTMSATSVLEFGDGTQTATITLPNSFFTTPTTFATLTVNRTSGTLNWGNNPITLTSNANIDAGTGYFIINNSLGIIGVGGNLNVNSGEFRIGVAANIPVTGNLNLVGDLRLTNAASNLVVTGNVTGSGTHTAASLGQLELVGIGSTISNTITYDNVNINTGGTINLTGSTTIGGTLRLTAGVLNVGAANTLTLTLNGSPVLRNGGS